MKKLYTLAIATLFAGVSFAQVDVEAVLVSPASGSTQNAGVISIEFDILNNGPDPIVEGDTVYFGALIGGTTIVDSDGTQNSVNGIIIPQGFGNITAGNSIAWSTIAPAVGGSFDVDVANITQSTEVCALIAGVGSDALSQTGDDEDNNPQNNVDCFTAEPTSSIEVLDFNDAVSVINTAAGIEISSELNNELNYAVVSVTGQQVANGSLTNFAPVSTDGWNRGIYIVRVEGAGEVTTKKIIVQ